MVAGVGDRPESCRSDDITDGKQKILYAHPYARAMGVPRHLLCNLDIFFVVLGYPYGIPANPLGNKKAPDEGSREPIRGTGGYMGVFPAGCNASVQSNFAFVNHFFNFWQLLG